MLSATTIGRVWWKLKMRLESLLGHAVPVSGCSLDVIFPVNSTFPASHFPIRNKSQMNDSYTYLTQRSNHLCGIAVSKFYLIDIRSIESEDPNWLPDKFIFSLVKFRFGGFSSVGSSIPLAKAGMIFSDF